MKRFNFLIGWCVAGIIFTIQVQAQDIVKSNLRLGLTYQQQNNDLPVLKASAKTKSGKKFEPVEGVAINFFFGEETAQGFLGQIKTNAKGESAITLPAKFKSKLDSLSAFSCIATVTSDNRFDDASAELEITKAKIELVLSEEDSVRTMTAKVFARADTGWVEVPEVEIKFVVRRLLSDLIAAEEEFYTTDEAGEVSAEYKLTMPGDGSGDLIIGTKIEDHDSFGTLLTTKPARWGIPVESDQSFFRRTLFATRDKTPFWLLIFPNLIIAAVWGFIIFLIYQIIRIRKLGNAHEHV